MVIDAKGRLVLPTVGDNVQGSITALPIQHGFALSLLTIHPLSYYDQNTVKKNMKYQGIHPSLYLLRGIVILPMTGTMNCHRHVFCAFSLTWVNMLPEPIENPSRLCMKLLH